MQNILLQVLIGLGVLLLGVTTGLWFWRQVVEMRMRETLGSSGSKVRAVASEKAQILTFLEQQKMARTTKQKTAAKLRETIKQRAADVAEARARDFCVLQQIGEPSKDKECFGAMLTLQPGAQPGKDIPAALTNVDHLCVIWAESEAAARRQMDIYFADKGPFRPTAFHRREG